MAVSVACASSAGPDDATIGRRSVVVTLEGLNAAGTDAAARELRRCNGSARWVRTMVGRRPFPTVEALADTADIVWASLGPDDWREAFAAHAKIGEASGDPRGGRDERRATPAHEEATGDRWGRQEQAGARVMRDDLRARLADGNRRYEERFGYIFIVCATGRRADEMVEMLEGRLRNDPGTELRVAAEEQRKITRLRLMKLLDER